jgi:Domain of unknown function (DUF4327)
MPKTLSYSIDMIRDEARHLVEEGKLNRQQPIYAMCRYISGREWECVELELDQNDYLLRDRIIDLLGDEDWRDD